MRRAFLLIVLFILVRCAAKHQGIAFEPYFPAAPDELFSASVVGEIQGLEFKEELSLFEKKRLLDLYLIEVRKLNPNHARAKSIAARAEVFRPELEPLLKRVQDLKSELQNDSANEPEAKGFEKPRLKKVYQQAYQAWNKDDNERAFQIARQITNNSEFKSMASKNDWMKILNLQFRVAMELGLRKELQEAYAQLKDFEKCAPETAQAGLIVALMTFGDGKGVEAAQIFKDQCDPDESLSNRTKRAYWKFRFYPKDSSESEAARRELLSLPMPGYYGYLSSLVRNEGLGVEIRGASAPRYLREGMSVSKEVDELLTKAEQSLKANLRKDAGIYIGKAVQLMRSKPSNNALPLLYSAYLLRGAGFHLDSMKVFTFLLGQDRQLSSEDLQAVQREIPEVFPRPFGGVIDSVAKHWNVDADFVYSIMRQESAFNPGANSSADARGLMQMMPALAKSLSVQWKGQKLYSDKLLYSSGENIKLAVFHLHQLQTWGPHYALMAASYNAGVSRVVKWWQRFGHLPLDVFVELIPIGETRNYVKLVLRNYLYYKALRLDGRLEPGLFSLNLPAIGSGPSPRL